MMLEQSDAWLPHTWDDPPRSRGRVLLATALTILCGAEWGMSGEEVRDAATGKGAEDDASRVDTACDLMGRALLEGRLRSSARPFGGGVPIDLAPDLWELDDFRWRMATSAIDPARPFDPEAQPTHWVFVDESDWETMLARLLQPSIVRDQEVTATLVHVEVGVDPTNEQPPENATGERFLRLPAVLERTGFSRATLYRRIGAGSFPEGVSLGGNITGWRERDVARWALSQAGG